MTHQVIAELTVVPLGTGTGLSSFVAACLEKLDAESRVKYELTSMGTIVLGPLDAVLDVAREMHEAPFGMGAMRVVTTIKIDDRRDKEASLTSKVKSVMQKKGKG